jgi:hypothetical protein
MRLFCNVFVAVILGYAALTAAATAVFFLLGGEVTLVEHER